MMNSGMYTIKHAISLKPPKVGCEQDNQYEKKLYLGIQLY